MTNNLIKFKTEFDIHAKYNEKGLYEAKKAAFQSEIQLSNNIQKITEKQFALKPLEIGFIQSVALKDELKFKEIQKIFLKYNADVLQQGQQAIPGLHLKTVVMDSMLKFLRMMMLAPDTGTKKKILDIAYYWFIKHLNPKSQRKSKDGLLKEIKQIVTDNKLLSKEAIEAELPSEIVKEQLHQYKVKARTCYTDIDAPSFELQNYHIHKVAYMNDRSEKTKDNEEDVHKRKRLLRVEFKKPNLEQYYLPHEEETKQQQKQQQQQNVIVPVGGAQGLVKPAEAVVAEQVPALTPQQQQMQLLMNQMGGQPQDPQQAPPEEDEDKKKGKLDPFVKVFLLKQQSQKQKKDSFQCPPINNLQRLKNNYKEQMQRQDDNFKGYMLDWAAHRSRFKTQVNRKMQSMRAFKDMSAIKEPRKVEDAMYKTRINEAIRDGRTYIKQMNKQSLNTEGGLSCFDRRRIKTVAATSSSPKPFSQLLQQNKRINKRQQFLDEIEDIKLKFAKQKIFTSMDAMRKGLMHPEEIEQGEKLEKIQYPSTLLSNPFFVVKKKKKKGKKKK